MYNGITECKKKMNAPDHNNVLIGEGDNNDSNQVSFVTNQEICESRPGNLGNVVYQSLHLCSKESPPIKSIRYNETYCSSNDGSSQHKKNQFTDQFSDVNNSVK